MKKQWSIVLLLPLTAIAGGPLMITTDQANAISQQLATQNVTVTTPAGVEDIIIEAPIAWASNNNLTLLANRNIIFAGQGTITNTAAGSVNLLADHANAQNGLIQSNVPAVIHLQSGQATIQYYQSSGMAAQNYTPLVQGGQLNALIQIDTPQDLQNINQNLSGHYALGKNLDLTGINFLPLGSKDTPFMGLLNGNAYTLSNLSIQQPKQVNIGLFAYIGKKGTVENINITNADITGYNTVGILAAINQGTINQASVQGVVHGYNNVGGLVGGNVNGSINNSHSVVTVYADQYFAGGLAGGNSEGNIRYSYSLATVNSTSSHVGGLIGDNYEGTVEECYAKGSVTGEDNVGGLSGGNDHGTFLNDAAQVNVTTTPTGIFVGGLSGDNIDDGVITNCYSTGLVQIGNTMGSKAPVPQYMGGLVGYGEGTVTNSYWDVETSHELGSDGGVGKSDAEMQQQNTYQGWDFAHIWQMQVYPELRMGWQ